MSVTFHAAHPKDPDAVLDYTVDWSTWLATGESIASYTVTAAAGITVDSDSEASGAVTVWLSGGTAGRQYDVAVRIVTDTTPARQDERTFRVTVAER